MKSIVSRIVKKREKKSEPVKQYHNPKKDGLYRICLNDECQTMFQIDDDRTRAGFCWTCYLKVLRSGHYLGPHMTHPPYKFYPESKPIIKPLVEENKPKQKFGKVSLYGGGVCSCKEEFDRKTIRQKRCEKCIKDSTRLSGSARQRKHSGHA